MQIYVLPLGGGEARKVTDFPGGVTDMIWTPDGGGFVCAGDVYPECPDLDCTRKRDEERDESKVSAKVHETLLYRHWDAYEDGKAQHLFHVPAEGGAPCLDAEGRERIRAEIRAALGGGRSAMTGPGY